MSALSGIIFPTTLKRWNIQNLDYNWYFMLAIFGGFFGLDYLYIGSPVGAALKFFMNLSTFGFWWYYDAINAAVGQDQIRLYGPSAPGFGPTGIAGGRFRDPKNPGADPKLKLHMNFLIYGIVLAFGGLFGIDHFVTGDMFAGLMNLICTISFIGFPISFLWYIYKIYRYALDTNECIDVHANYFGATPGMANECPSILMIITIWICKTALAVVQLVPGIGPVVGGLLEQLTKNLEAAYGLVKKEMPNVHTVIQAERARPIPNDMKAAPAPAPQTGGGDLQVDSGLLAPFFALTIGLIVVSSLVLSLRRLRQNGSEGKAAATTTVKQPGDQESDDPPQPGDPGVPA
jgi:hypothetical protein